MPNPLKLIATIKQASNILRRQPGRTGKFVELTGCDEVLIVGDLHGHLTNFKRILQLAKLAEHPNRHIVLQELVHGLLRYTNDGGELSHRLVDVVSAFICQYPGRVHYLLGNHELAQWHKREIAKNNESMNQLFITGVCSAYPEHVEEVLAAYDELFDALPIAIRLHNRVFLSHSLPGASRLDTWSLDLLKKDHFDDEDYKLGGCVHAVVWGRDTSEPTAKRYLQLVDADFLVTGHIPCDTGYDLPNPVQIVLDAKDDHGHVLLLPVSEPLNQEQVVKHLIKLSDIAV